MRVLVTRGEPAAETLAGMLRDAGHECLVAPAIRVIAAFEPERVASAMTKADAMLLASRHALIAATTGPGEGLEVWAVGASTARAARERGFDVTRVGDAGLDGLIAAVLNEDITPGRVFWPCGNLSDPSATEPLETAGYKVQRMVVYENENPWDTGPPEGIDAIEAAIFASPSSVERVASSLTPDDRATALATWRCVAIGRTTAAAARAVGFEEVAIADEPTSAGLVAALS